MTFQVWAGQPSATLQKKKPTNQQKVMSLICCRAWLGQKKCLLRYLLLTTLLCHAWLKHVKRPVYNLIMSSLGSNSFTLTSPTLIAYLSKGYPTYSFLF